MDGLNLRLHYLRLLPSAAQVINGIDGQKSMLNCCKAAYHIQLYILVLNYWVSTSGVARLLVHQLLVLETAGTAPGPGREPPTMPTWAVARLQGVERAMADGIVHLFEGSG